MDAIKLEAQPRETGKKAARSLRRDGRVPCVLYGRETEPVNFSLSVLEMRPLIYTTTTNRVQIELDGEQYECILKDLDYHPVSDQPVHADFQTLTEGEMITLTVPVRYEGVPAGQVAGGDTQYILTDVEMEGIEFVSPGRQTLVTVVPPTMEVLEEAEEEALEGLEDEEGIAAEGETADTAESEADEEGAGATA